MLEKVFYWDADKDYTLEDVAGFIKQHAALVRRYDQLQALYKGDHDILHARPKPTYKPDNRLVANYAKYIVDTFAGFFIGVPVKVSHDRESVSAAVSDFEAYNDLEDEQAELAKLTSIYGHAFELLYVDEAARVCVVAVDPHEGFLVRDTSVAHEPLFAVTYGYTKDRVLQGHLMTADAVQTITTSDGKLTVIDEKPHFFGGVPFVEYTENSERQGAFENVETLINAYNKALSEKANDVDYFADAYMKVLGAPLDEEGMRRIRDYRVINLAGGESDKVIVDFMQKPNADETQENLLGHLERLIFSMSMVANISDENFGTSSGIALKYKLLSMSNLATGKARKFTKSFNDRYWLLSHVPGAGMTPEEALGLRYKFTQNVPANVAEEAQTAAGLMGIVSDETVLETLSIVENVKDEMGRIAAQESLTDYDHQE